MSWALQVVLALLIGVGGGYVADWFWKKGLRFYGFDFIYWLSISCGFSTYVINENHAWGWASFVGVISAAVGFLISEVILAVSRWKH